MSHLIFFCQSTNKLKTKASLTGKAVAYTYAQSWVLSLLLFRSLTGKSVVYTKNSEINGRAPSFNLSFLHFHNMEAKRVNINHWATDCTSSVGLKWLLFLKKLTAIKIFFELIAKTNNGFEVMLVTKKNTFPWLGIFKTTLWSMLSVITN